MSVKQPTSTRFRTTHGATTSAAPASSTSARHSVRRDEPDPPERCTRRARAAERRAGCCRGSRGRRRRRAAPARSERKRSPRRRVSRTSATARRRSRISRFTCTSCQTRYGERVAASACEQSAGASEQAPAERQHEQRVSYGHGRLREADDEPVPPEDPVERDEEEASRAAACTRTESPGTKPKVPLVDERAREVVALLRERGEDVAALEGATTPGAGQRRRERRPRASRAAAHAARWPAPAVRPRRAARATARA